MTVASARQFAHGDTFVAGDWSTLPREPGLAGHVARLSARTTRSIAAAVDLDLRWDIGWQRQEIDRLVDADHSALAALWTRRLEGWGWIVRNEVSFSRYGDRGRIDLLAYHPGERMLLVIEIKTVIVDAQALLGGVDVKVRVAPFAAAELGWRPRLTVPALIVREGSTARRRIEALAPLFTRYSLRGQAAGAWLRDPVNSPAGLLTFTDLSSTDGVELDERAAAECGSAARIHAQGCPPSARQSRHQPPNTEGRCMTTSDAGWERRTAASAVTSRLRTLAGACGAACPCDSRGGNRPA